MKPYIAVLILSACWVITGLPLGQCAAQDKGETERLDRVSADRKLLEPVVSSAVQSYRAMAESRAAAQKIIQDYSDPVAARFIAAKIAWLSGRPSEAIAVLEGLVEKYPESATREPGLPVIVSGNFWMATIARQYGDFTRAKRAYSDVERRVETDDKLSSLVTLCYLYEAEIEYEAMGNKEAALDLLEKAKAVPLPQALQGRYNIFPDLLDFQILRLTKGPEEARLSLKGNHPKTDDAVLLAIGTMQIEGMAANEVFHSDPRGQVILDEAALESATQCRTSPMDREMAQMVLGFSYQHSSDPQRAETCYRDLFAGDSFFAPEAGVCLAVFHKQQGNAEQAAKILAELKQRFPGYAERADELLKR